jgi:hypothetical protein
MHRRAPGGSAVLTRRREEFLIRPVPAPTTVARIGIGRRLRAFTGLVAYIM